MTAVVTIDGAHRSHAIRMPNAALAFRPTSDVLSRIGQVENSTPAKPAVDEGGHEVREVWKYDGLRLSPVWVTAGLSDEEWTEVVSGSLSAGDRLATAATLSERQRRLRSGS
jgi:hypothetical protein